ncbi:glycosyl hydrolase family 28-related protein [Paenibacillus hemerocallicola]|nr:glycosyl hydrolase family 28-related protein [Paenibacillus hemerocallicola]
MDKEDRPGTAPVSRRKLLASIGALGVMTAVGAGGWKASAGTVSESVYSGPGCVPDTATACCPFIDITAAPYNAQPGGAVDNSAAFQQALIDAGEGGCIYVPAGDYLIQTGFTVSSSHVTLTGTGRLIAGGAIYVNADAFTCSGLRFKALNTTSQLRAIRAETGNVNRPISRITIEKCEFEDFFYATDFRGTGTYPVSDIAVYNCKSTAPAGKNAGHFQNVNTMNTYYAGNSCYNGQNATSYNFFGGNGKIKLIGNYDFNNSYGSCEIENCPGAEVMISSNNFDKQLWIDDSSTVVIDGNIVKERIFVTVQDNDCDRLVISNNITGRIYVSDFGTYRAGKVKNADICHNQIIGPGSWGIFVSGKYTERCRIKDNYIASSVFAQGSIGVGRAAGLDMEIVDNRINGPVVFSSTGGSIRLYGNLDYTLSGNHETSAMEKLFRSSGATLDVADVGFVRSKQIAVPASGTNSALFVLAPTSAETGRLVKVTFSSRQQGVSGAFDACEQKVLIAGSAGGATVASGPLQKVLANAATDFTTGFSLDGGGTGLTIQIANPNPEAISVRIHLEQYEAVHDDHFDKTYSKRGVQP